MGAFGSEDSKRNLEKNTVKKHHTMASIKIMVLVGILVAMLALATAFPDPFANPEALADPEAYADPEALADPDPTFKKYRKSYYRRRPSYGSYYRRTRPSHYAGSYYQPSYSYGHGW